YRIVFDVGDEPAGGYTAIDVLFDAENVLHLVNYLGGNINLADGGYNVDSSVSSSMFKLRFESTEDEYATTRSLSLSIKPVVTDHADRAALEAATIPHGGYHTCLAEGLIRLGSPPNDEVT